MLKLGILVGEEQWTFFEEIFDDLVVNYQTEVFKSKNYNLPVFKNRLNRVAYHKKIYSLMYQNDVCFFEWASEHLMAATQMPKQCAIVTRLHSFELYDWAPKINWDSVDRIVLVSRAMQQMFCDLYPEHANKTVVIYNGRSLDKFIPPVRNEFKFNLGMLCRITPIKRIYEIILMLSSLKEKGYPAYLHIAGEPVDDLRYAAAIIRLVEKLHLKDHVIFYGHVSHTPAWLKNIDIFISNSFWEGQSVALLEAMASGCYCLSHNWAGAEEMLPSENLYISEAELVRKIIAYAEMSDELKQQNRFNMRSIAIEKFNIEKTKFQIRQVIEDVGVNYF